MAYITVTISFYSPGARRFIPEDLSALLKQNVPTIMAKDFKAKHPS